MIASVSLARAGRAAVLGLLVLAAGCAQVSHVASGEVVVRDRLALTVDRPWNQFERTGADNIPTWTLEGFNVDALRIYAGLKDGDLIAATPNEPKGSKPLAFRATMQTAEVVALFESLYSRGGSTFTLERLSPQPFAGAAGFRFEFSSVRKHDDVRLRGVGWGTVRNGELFVITYTAPRLTFFPKGLPAAEALAATARIRG